VSTKALNQAAKRNAGRFPEDFMFQLTDDEARALRSQNVTSSEAALRSQIVTLDDDRTGPSSDFIARDRPSKSRRRRL